VVIAAINLSLLETGILVNIFFSADAIRVKRKYVHKQAKMESQRNVAYSKNKNLSILVILLIIAILMIILNVCYIALFAGALLLALG